MENLEGLPIRATRWGGEREETDGMDEVDDVDEGGEGDEGGGGGGGGAGRKGEEEESDPSGRTRALGAGDETKHLADASHEDEDGDGGVTTEGDNDSAHRRGSVSVGPFNGAMQPHDEENGGPKGDRRGEDTSDTPGDEDGCASPSTATLPHFDGEGESGHSGKGRPIECEGSLGDRALSADGGIGSPPARRTPRDAPRVECSPSGSRAIGDRTDGALWASRGPPWQREPSGVPDSDANDGSSDIDNDGDNGNDSDSSDVSDGSFKDDSASDTHVLAAFGAADVAESDADPGGANAEADAIAETKYGPERGRDQGCRRERECDEGRVFGCAEVGTHYRTRSIKPAKRRLSVNVTYAAHLCVTPGGLPRDGSDGGADCDAAGRGAGSGQSIDRGEYHRPSGGIRVPSFAVSVRHLDGDDMESVISSRRDALRCLRDDLIDIGCLGERLAASCEAEASRTDYIPARLVTALEEAIYHHGRMLDAIEHAESLFGVTQEAEMEALCQALERQGHHIVSVSVSPESHPGGGRRVRTTDISGGGSSSPVRGSDRG